MGGHLDWQAAFAPSHPDPPAGMTGIDIVPHLLWPIGGMRLVRGLHLVLGFPRRSCRRGDHLLRSWFPLNTGQTIAVLAVAALAYSAWTAGKQWPIPGHSARTVHIRHFDWSRPGIVLGIGVLGLWFWFAARRRPLAATVMFTPGRASLSVACR